MKDGALHFALRRLQRLATAPRVWGALVGIAVLLGAAGPFGTYASMPLLPRLAYWMGVACATFAAGYLTAQIALALMPPAVSRLARLALAGLAASLPVTLIVVALNRALFGHFDSAGGVLALYANCAVATSVLVYLFTLLDPSARAEETAAAAPRREAPAGPTADAAGGPPGAPAMSEPAAPVRPPIVERLAPRLRGTLVSLTVRDHYVEVRTDRGTGLVLIRFADAIRETAGIPGMQIHRSHWVALDAVQGAVRRDGKLMLKLPGGVQLPVSRSHADAVRKAGLA